MPRILRNYLLSFLIIGLFLLAVHLIDRWADQRPATPSGPVPAAPAMAPPSAPNSR
jgi:hypothetical protein